MKEGNGLIFNPGYQPKVVDIHKQTMLKINNFIYGSICEVLETRKILADSSYYLLVVPYEDNLFMVLYHCCPVNFEMTYHA